MAPVRRHWPVALVLVFVGLLAWYLLYTQRIVDALRDDAQTLSELYVAVLEGVNDPAEDAAVEALLEAQATILETGVPMILTGPDGAVLAAENLPFEAELETPEGQERVRAYVARLDAEHPAVGEPGASRIHFGDPPVLRRLRWIPWLQAGAFLLIVGAGAWMLRSQLRLERERSWSTMARELAHQLGTPLSSLKGWVEVVGLPAEERATLLRETDAAREMERDVGRLERVARRFELIGRAPELSPVDVADVAGELDVYIRARLPRFGTGIALRMDVPPDLPPVRGNAVLLEWALENVVKNSLDALAGRGGTIAVEARRSEDERVILSVRDDGPGVPREVRDRIFESGTTTKPGGWGVGLTLTRRIVEDVHDGRIELLDRGEGATFELRLPRAEG